MFIIIYLLVLDDSSTSKRFTKRTEELNKCYEPLQKLRVRLWPCKKVQEGKDQEKQQSETKPTIRYLYHENISKAE